MNAFKTFCSKPTVKEIIFLTVNSMFAGMLIAMAGVVYLLSPIVAETKFVGSFMFSFGLIMVILFNFKLFTGMISDLPYTNWKKWYHLAICFFGNGFGCLLVAEILRVTNLGVNLAELTVAVAEVKLGHGLVSTFFSAIMCGICITLAVHGCRVAKEKNFSAVLVVILPIIVFVLCGFEHVVANMFYLFMAKAPLDGYLLGFLAVNVAGNIVGGIFVPLFKKWQAVSYKAS